MKHTHDVLRERLHAKAGLWPKPTSLYTSAMLKESKWSRRFEEAMRIRLIMGAMRYETPEMASRKQFVGRPTEIQTADIISRIRKFQKDGNTEHLVDAANLCMIEFETTNHPLAHFEGTDRV